MNKKILYFTFIISLSSVNFAFAKSGKISIPETSGWVLEDEVISDDSVVNIDVVKLEDGRLRAYYMNLGVIGSLISTDDGKSFSLEDGNRIQQGQHHAALKLDDGRIRLYYSKQDDRNIYSAISSDGLSFTEEAGVRLVLGAPGDPDEGGMIHPVIVKLPDGSLKLYYDALGQGGNFPENSNGIMSAGSTDGLTFVKDKGVRIRANSKPIGFVHLVFSSFAEFEDGLYKLYFTGESDNVKKLGVFVAVSENGVDFTINKRPIIKRDKRAGPPTNGQLGRVGMPQDVFIVNVDGGKRLFYWVEGNDRGIFSAFNDLLP